MGRTVTRLAGAALSVALALAALGRCPLPESACRPAAPPPCHGHADGADDGGPPDCCSGGHQVAFAAESGLRLADAPQARAPAAMPSLPSLPPAVAVRAPSPAGPAESPHAPPVLLHAGRSPPLA